MDKTDTDQTSQPTQTMQELYQWMKTWEKYVSNDKRSAGDTSGDTSNTARKRTR